MRKLYPIVVNLFLSLILGLVIGVAFNVSPEIPALGIFALSLIPKGTKGVVAYASSLDISALPSKLKDYAMKDTEEILTKVMVDGMGFLDYFQILTGVTDEIPLNELVIESLVQPGGKDTFDPKNNVVKFKARVGKVRAIKVDLQFKHTQVVALYKSYLGKVKGGHIDPYQIPFEAFIFEKVIERAKNDIRMKALFKGEYDANGTDAVDIFDGILTKIAALIISTDIPSANVAAGAPITSSNAVDEVRKVVAVVYDNEDYQDVPMVCLVSPQTKMNYELDYQATYGSLPYNQEFKKTFIDGTQIELVAEPAMTGSDRIVITPKTNLFWLVDDENSGNNIIVEKALRNINIMLDMHAAPEIGIAELIWCNDQE